MKIALSTLIITSLVCPLALAHLKFQDTWVKTSPKIRLHNLPSANSFVQYEKNRTILVSRTSPSTVVNAKSVDRIWKQNLEVVGITAAAEDCKAVSKLRYICNHSSAKKQISLSYSRKDVVTVIVSGNAATSDELQILELKR